MKNKKILSVILGLSCVAILIGVVALNRKSEPEFTPAAAETTTTTSWEEKHLQTNQEQTVLPETEQTQTGTTGSTEDLTQAMVTETPDEVITDLTPPVQKEQVQADTKPKAPPAETWDSQAEAPSKPQPEPEQRRESESEAPTQGDTGHEGQVYDPVFGWLTPSPMQGQITDNDGDVNKQVGTMN